MTSNVTACKYTPDATSPLQDLSSDQVALLQQKKAHDISAKVGRIVQEYFGYTGDEVYSVKLQKTSITFDISGDHRTLTLNTTTNIWELDDNGVKSDLDASKTFEISDTVLGTLSKIRTAWETNPASGGPSSSSSAGGRTSGGSAASTVNVYVNGHQVQTSSRMTPQQQAAALRGQRQAQEYGSDVESDHVDMTHLDVDDDSSLPSSFRGRHRRRDHSQSHHTRSSSPLVEERD